MVKDSGETGQTVELLANIRRLTRIVLDRLEKGSAEGTLDQSQVRMLGKYCASLAAALEAGARRNGKGKGE